VFGVPPLEGRQRRQSTDSHLFKAGSITTGRKSCLFGNVNLRPQRQKFPSEFLELVQMKTENDRTNQTQLLLGHESKEQQAVMIEDYLLYNKNGLLITEDSEIRRNFIAIDHNSKVAIHFCTERTLNKSCDLIFGQQ